MNICSTQHGTRKGHPSPPAIKALLRSITATLLLVPELFSAGGVFCSRTPLYLPLLSLGLILWELSMPRSHLHGEGHLNFGESPGVGAYSGSFSNEALTFLSLRRAQETVSHFLEQCFVQGVGAAIPISEHTRGSHLSLVLSVSAHVFCSGLHSGHLVCLPRVAAGGSKCSAQPKGADCLSKGAKAPLALKRLSRAFFCDSVTCVSMS